MGRPRTGSIAQKDGKLIARVSYTDATNKRRWKKRVVESRTEGNQWIRQALSDLDESSYRSDGTIATLTELALWYERTQAIEPIYSDGHKIAGLRDRRTTLYRLRLLKEYFGARRLHSITYGQIEAYKLQRLGQKSPHGNSIKLSTIHRELSLLRNMLNLAVREGWLRHNPFNDGKPLIIKAHEPGRERVLTLDEENRLLAVCVDFRAHLRPIVICAIDTGMRAREIFSLTWPCVNLAARTLTVKAMNSKTLREKRVPISTRLLRELRALEPFKRGEDELVFGVEKSVAKAWKTACRLAGIADLRLNDLRHTFDSRLMESGVNPLVVSRLMGHSGSHQNVGGLKMTYHYTHLTERGADGAIEALDSIEKERLRLTTATNRGHKR